MGPNFWPLESSNSLEALIALGLARHRAFIASGEMARYFTTHASAGFGPSLMAGNALSFIAFSFCTSPHVEAGDSVWMLAASADLRMRRSPRSIRRSDSNGC